MSHVSRKLKSKEYIMSPDKWARGVCMLVKRGPDRRPYAVGFLRRDWFMDKWQTVLIVYMANIFQMKKYSIGGIIDYTSVPQKQYANVDMIFKDGWEVD